MSSVESVKKWWNKQMYKCQYVGIGVGILCVSGAIFYRWYRKQSKDEDNIEITSNKNIENDDIDVIVGDTQGAHEYMNNYTFYPSDNHITDSKEVCFDDSDDEKVYEETEMVPLGTSKDTKPKNTIRERRHKIVTDKDSNLYDPRPIVQCIGRVLGVAKLDHLDEIKVSLGTGTVFKYDEKTGNVFVITCAHNIRYDVSKIDMDADEGVEFKNLKPIIFERDPDSKELNKRDFDKDVNTDPKRYEIEKYWYHNNYSFKSKCKNDLAVLRFKDKSDEFYKKIFQHNKNVIHIFPSDNIPKRFIFSYSIIGYPSCKAKQGDLWGMSAKSRDEKQKKRFIKTDKDNTLFLYNAIDTEKGQSGSPIFLSFKDKTYGIVGIHTGGLQTTSNWGVSLNYEKFEWIDKQTNLRSS